MRHAVARQDRVVHIVLYRVKRRLSRSGSLPIHTRVVSHSGALRHAAPVRSEPEATLTNEMLLTLMA